MLRLFYLHKTMKIYISIIFFILSTVYASAQKVTLDKTNADGIRVIECDPLSKLGFNRWVYSEGLWSCCFGGIRYEGGKYSIILLAREKKSPLISVGKKLVLDFEDGTSMELNNAFEVNESTLTKGPGHKRMARPQYPVTDEQLDKIIKGNVVYVHLDTDTHGVIEREVRDADERTFSEGIIGEGYKKIQEALSK